jgi:hypothetical protein
MKLSLTISATTDCNDIALQVFINDTEIFQSTAKCQQQIIEHIISEDPSDHVLKIKMTGKNRKHTQINSQGEIVSDVAFIVDRLEFEDIDMTPIFYYNNPCYTHNLNGSGVDRVDEFSGFMGCNGTIEFKFYTPIYLWMYQKI